jgi:PKD repeat protein
MGIYNVMLGTLNDSTSGVTDGYQDYSCTQGTVLNAGLVYPISIQTSASTNENVRVWLDWNNDGAFDPTTELLFASDNQRLHTGLTNALPLAAVTGQPLRLRVSADAATSPLPTPCSTPQYSQVEDYRVTLLANTQPPQAAFALNTAQACAGTFAFHDQSIRQTTAWRWTFGDGATSTLQHPTHTYAQPGTYTVQLRACNAFGCDSTRQTAAFFATYPAVASCQPATASYCCNYGITRVDFGTFTQSSRDGQAGYEDYTCISRTTVSQGQAVPVRIITNRPQDTWVFLDADNNGTFATGELLYQALNTTNPQGFVVIPSTTLTNRPLRLRIISDAVSTTNGALTPCANRVSGQVEDYAVVVVSAVPCPMLGGQGGQAEHYFSAGLGGYSAVDSVASALLLTRYSPGATVQWERSPNTTPAVWQPIFGATLPTLFYTRSSAAPDSLYRAAVSCVGGIPVYSTTVRTSFSRSTLHTTGCSSGVHIQRVALHGTMLDNSSACNSTQGNAYRLFSPAVPTRTAEVMRGATYQLLVTTSRSCRLSVYVGTFAQRLLPVQTVLATTAGGLTSIVLHLDSLRIPATTAVLQLRVRCDQDYSRWPTNQPVDWDGWLVGGETEDYLLRVIPYVCPGTVTSGPIVAPTATQCPRDTFNLGTVGETPGARLQWQSSPDSLTWQSLTGQTGHVLRTRIAATTYFRVLVQGCAGAVPSVVVRVVATPIVNCYCSQTMGPVPATAPVISRMQLIGTTLDNTSPATSGGPGRVYFPPTVPTQTAELVQGGTYTLALTLANPTAGASTAVHAVAWLDLNRDGAYDSLEWVHLLRTPAGISTTYLATLPVAASAQPGTMGLRLRVGNNISFRPSQACTNLPATGQGEIEDYTVSIVAAPCTGTLTAGSITAQANPNARARLRSVAYTPGAALQWQQSYDTATWANIAGATTDEFPVWYNTTLYFRLRAQCSGNTAYSAAIQPQDFNQLAGCAVLGPQANNALNAYVDEVEIGGTPLLNIGSGRSSSEWYQLPYATGSTHSTEAVGYWPPQQQGFTATLVRGQSYPLRLVGVGIAGFYNPTGTSIGAWVDWNQNGTFDTSEFYGNPPNGVGRVSYSTTLTVPPTAALGTLLLRVRAIDNIQSSYGCRLQASSSEMEDYMLTVADQPALVVPTLTASLCVGQPLRLESSGAGAGATYRWLGPNGFQASGAVATRATFTAADAGTYIAIAERAGERLITSLYVPLTPPCLPTATALPARPRPSLVVFPNPTTGQCTVQLPAGSAPLLEVLVRTTTGQVVARSHPATPHNAHTPEVPLDLRGQPAGLYFVELRTEQGFLFGKVVVE